MNQTIDVSQVVLSTERLLLRPWREEDVEDFYAYARVDGVGQRAGWLPHGSIEESRTILRHFIQGKKTFALEYEGKVIGSLGVECYEEAYFPELSPYRGRSLGYVLSRDYWGRGLMPESVRAVMNWLFETDQLDFILISHFDWNHRSARVIEKCGLKYIKTTKFETRYGTVETTPEYIAWNPRLGR